MEAKKYRGIKRRRCRGGMERARLCQESREKERGGGTKAHHVDEALLDTVESGPQSAADQAQT